MTECTSAASRLGEMAPADEILAAVRASSEEPLCISIRLNDWHFAALAGLIRDALQESQKSVEACRASGVPVQSLAWVEEYHRQLVGLRERYDVAARKTGLPGLHDD